MLEIKGLTKIYRSKTGEEVRALDGIDLAFPETGMVFILGKSGSGKSTLLNIMGGLDSYDSGEFIIKGKSSRDFAGSDFDAYRNTFIGFIFQEYNVLDDFTVGANIALALELQGKKAMPEAIGSILEQVELTEYAKRKPNELSGGQKQRVAIARALVKDPQIIMADEPTGALDSATGKQIFDTLKKLSQTKLVLVVSHDRDFAERYADRIVELADGRIISDVTKHEHAGERVSTGVEKIGENILRIKAGYTLTEEDLRMINAYLAEHNSDVLISGDERINDDFRSAAGISETGATAVFEKTKANEDYTLRRYEKKDSHFIRSRLPARKAIHIGASSLKHKKFRLVMTVFLSLIAFALFGFADTLASYEQLNAAVDSLYDSNIRNASVALNVRHRWYHANGEMSEEYYEAALNDLDIAELNEKTGLTFIPVYAGSMFSTPDFTVRDSMHSYGGNIIYTGRFHGLVTMTEETLSAVGLKTDAGHLPTAKGEIAITELMFRQFNEYGFVDAQTREKIDAGKLTMAEDGSSNSILGKKIYIRTSQGKSFLFTVVGVVDTHFDYDRYAAYLPTDSNAQEENIIEDLVLKMEIESELNYGFHALGFAHTEDIKTLSGITSSSAQSIGTYMYDHSTSYMHLVITRTVSSDTEKDDKDKIDTNETTIRYVATSEVLKNLAVTWLDGEKTVLGKDEIVLPMSLLEDVLPKQVTIEIDYAELDTLLTELYGNHWIEQRESRTNFYEKVYAAARAHYGWDRPDNEVVTQMQTDVYPFFYEKLGIALPAKDMTLHNGIYDENVRWLLEYSLADTEPKNGKFVFEVDKDFLSKAARYLYADYSVSTHDLVNDPFYLRLMLDHYYYIEQLPEGISDEQLWSDAIQFYALNLLKADELGYYQNEYGLSGMELEALVKKAFGDRMNISFEELSDSFNFTLSSWKMVDGVEINTGINAKEYKIVGYYDSTMHHNNAVICDTLKEEFWTWLLGNMDEYSTYEEIADHENGIWAYAIAPMPKDKEVLTTLVSMTYEEGVELRYGLENYVMDTLDSFNEFIEIGSQVFLYVGLGFAVFSALLLMNFIATSISYKKREIGVLRAVGARSSDVFKIFFSEALIIALINFVCSTVVVIAGVIIANDVMHAEGISITLLSYGARQFVLMLLISIAVALIASFLPVNRIAKKKPVDAIKDR